MSKVQECLNEYIRDQENSEKNFALALAYHELKQTAAAISFYLRAAELTQDKILAYSCLLKIAECFEQQGNRDNTVRGLYKHALCLLPERPEAYFLLSRFNERRQWYIETYTLAEMGLNFSKEGLPPLRIATEYPGRYGLIFEKAVAAWWWGKFEESRRLFRELDLQLQNKMSIDNLYLSAVKNNINKIGS